MGRVTAGLTLIAFVVSPVWAVAWCADSPQVQGSGQSILVEGVRPWTTVQFLKLVGKGGHGKQGFSLVLYLAGPIRWPFARGNAEFRVDRTSYPAPVLTVEQRMTGMYTVLSVCAIYVEPLLGEKVKTAERVVLGIPLETGRSQMWEVPGPVLAEWKKVIEGAGP